ncbi:MAG: DMT family transporter [Rhodomicrobium sp.]|nr:DMT family transporter [Rhodomicrobium sp.]
MARLSPYRLSLLAAVFCALYSSAFPVAKIALADSPPLLFLTARFCLAGSIMLLAAALYGQALPGRREIMLLAVLGTFNNAMYLSLSYIGMRSISAGLSALIISANPILTALAATALLRERMTLRKAVGLVLAFCGVAFIVQARLSGGTESAHGIAMTCAALLALVAGTILFKLLAPRSGLWVGNGIQNLAGGIAVAPFAFGLESVSSIRPGWALLTALLYVALCVSIIGLLIWFYLLTAAGATAASSYHFLTPPLGVMFGWLLLGEHISGFDLLGTVPVAFGIYLVTRSDVRLPSPEPVAGHPIVQPDRRVS